MKIEVANCRTLKYKMQRIISQLIIMLASANKQKAGINRKHFRAIGINFERKSRGRESGGHKYFLAPPDSHIFSPYFRVPKRGHYFFMPQWHTLWTLRSDTSIQQEHAFSVATKLNVRGLWRTELRIVNCARDGHICTWTQL